MILGRDWQEGRSEYFYSTRKGGFTRVEMTFTITGAVPREVSERAIALSRDTYCSVLNSMAPDIEWVITIA